MWKGEGYPTLELDEKIRLSERYKGANQQETETYKPKASLCTNIEVALSVCSWWSVQLVVKGEYDGISRAEGGRVQ
jgi:hypothetical protein